MAHHIFILARNPGASARGVAGQARECSSCAEGAPLPRKDEWTGADREVRCFKRHKIKTGHASGFYYFFSLYTVCFFARGLNFLNSNFLSACFRLFFRMK